MVKFKLSTGNEITGDEKVQISQIIDQIDIDSMVDRQTIQIGNRKLLHLIYKSEQPISGTKREKEIYYQYFLNLVKQGCKIQATIGEDDVHTKKISIILWHPKQSSFYSTLA
jgi:hypothetical protein